MDPIHYTIKMLLPTIASNIILLVIVFVWAKLSIENNKLMDVSNKFIVLAVILSGQEAVKLVLILKDLLFPVINNVVN